MIKPLGDRVIIEPDALEKKTKTGLLLPHELQTNFRTGIVKAIGPGLLSTSITEVSTEQFLSVKIGDKVMFENNIGTPIKFEGDDKEYILVRESYIAGIL